MLYFLCRLTKCSTLLRTLKSKRWQEKASTELTKGQLRLLMKCLEDMRKRRELFMREWGRICLTMENQIVSNHFHFLNLINQTTAMEQKIKTLHDTLNTYKISFTQGSEVLNISRENIFEDSFEQFMEMNLQKVRRRILLYLGAQDYF